MTTEQPVNTIEFRPSVYLLICFGCGVFLDRWLGIEWKFSIAASIVFLCVWIAFYWKNCFKFSLLALTMCAVFAGAYWHHGRWSWFAENDLGSFCNDGTVPVCVRAKVLGEGKYLAADQETAFEAIPPSEKTSFRIQPLLIRDGANWVTVTGQCNLVVFGKVSEIRFGDEIEVVGNLHRYRGPTTPGNFDVRNFYRAKQLICAINVYAPESINVRQSAPKYSSAALLSSLRIKLDRLLWQYNSDEQAGFASALLLGNRSQIPNEQRRAFLTTGTSHLLAISGLHVGILASIFLILYRLGILRRNHALMATIVFVFFYAWLVEFRPPVVRAAILLSLFCAGKLIGRSGLEFDLLAIAGFIVLLLNPSDLFQLGPQLSFLAVTTLVVFKSWLFPEPSQDPIDKLIRNTRSLTTRLVNKFVWRGCQMVLVSLMIWLMGLPLVASQFHLVTPIACVANPIVMFPVAIALFASLGIFVFGGWFPVAGYFFGAITSTCLEFVSDTIAIMDGFDWGHWWTAGPTVFVVILFYAVGLFLCVLPFKNTPGKLIWWFACWAVFAWLLPLEFRNCFPRFGSKCTVIDVGHGSSVMLQLSNGQTLLYDAGSLSSSKFAADTVSNLLWSEQIEHLDAIIISHSDLDHYNAVPELLKRFSVGVVYVSQPMSEDDSKANATLFEYFEQYDVLVEKLARNDFVDLSKQMRLDVLLPPEIGTSDSDNSDSIVLLVQVDGKNVLMPGDLEGNGMQMLLQSDPIDCDLVLVPHHGSKHSQPKEFVEWCKPELAVISSGRSRLDNDVVETIAESGCEVYTTVENGTLCFDFDRTQLSIARFVDGKWQRLRK